MTNKKRKARASNPESDADHRTHNPTRILPNAKDGDVGRPRLDNKKINYNKDTPDDKPAPEASHYETTRRKEKMTKKQANFDRRKEEMKKNQGKRVRRNMGAREKTMADIARGMPSATLPTSSTSRLRIHVERRQRQRTDPESANWVVAVSARHIGAMNTDVAEAGSDVSGESAMPDEKEGKKSDLPQK
ncbi:hypothetical protein PMIN06_007349 [Paraphaeosphaeria minitans]